MLDVKECFVPEEIRVAELFAGVGGFRLALEGCTVPEKPEWDMPAAGPYRTVWANQWEPPGKPARQFAWRCYEARFGTGSCVNADIAAVLDEYEAGAREIPDFDMLVGGFPCQDYSVAKPLSRARGIEGKKGVLWWEIYRMLRLKKPRFLLLENVDRLLKSPVSQRGRDFAIILSCLFRAGYSVEWRVVNAADYGMPQKRRRVYIVGEREAKAWDLERRLFSDGTIARAFPAVAAAQAREIEVGDDPYELSQSFGAGAKVSPFFSGGVMQSGHVLTAKLAPVYDGPATLLKDIVVPDAGVPERFFIEEGELSKWEYQRSAKKEPRTTKAGFSYMYSEGAMSWPDPLDAPARTILTGEGGSGASRTKHAVRGDSGRIRRLVPEELERAQMFPAGWTDVSMTDGQRAFCMGNALVVGIPHAIGKVLTADFQAGASA